MPRTNQDKETPIDESILDETPPDINTPQDKEEDPEEKKSEEDNSDEPEEKTEVVEEEKTEEKDIPEKEIETEDQKEQRYKAQQTEAQIQAAKNRSLIDKVDEATKVGDPTTDEMKAFVSKDGVDWEELTIFEQSMARKSYLAEKRFDLVNEAVQDTKKIDAWAEKVDTFIDEGDGKPEFVKLSGHEADFRKFSMKEAHRGTPIDVLYKAFTSDLPTPVKKRGALFETAGGGEKEKVTGKITDADAVAELRANNPREFKRQVKAGNIDLEI